MVEPSKFKMSSRETLSHHSMYFKLSLSCSSLLSSIIGGSFANGRGWLCKTPETWDLANVPPPPKTGPPEAGELVPCAAGAPALARPPEAGESDGAWAAALVVTWGREHLNELGPLFRRQVVEIQEAAGAWQRGVHAFDVEVAVRSPRIVPRGWLDADLSGFKSCFASLAMCWVGPLDLGADLRPHDSLAEIAIG